MGSDGRAADATARAAAADRAGAEPKEFAGKVTIVTGGGSGIGYGIARAFALEGARVAIAGRTSETLRGAAAAIEAMGGAPVLPVEADVAKPSDCERMVAAAVDRFGAVDILVNNAAYFAVLPLIEAEPAEAERFFAVNVAGPLNAARAFARRAIESGRTGAIVNVSSIAAGRAVAGLGLYSATKAALDSLTRSMALEWAGKGVRVNAVAPGHVKTEGVLADFRAGRLDEAAMIRRIPVGRIADFDDVAAAVLFLCSERARQIVGQVLAVDGGEGF